MKISNLVPALALPACLGLALTFAAPGPASAAAIPHGINIDTAAPAERSATTGLTQVAGRFDRRWRQWHWRNNRWQRRQIRRHRRAVRHARRAHIQWCFDRYRTYDLRSNTYIGYDHRIHQCRSPFSRSVRRWR